MHLEARSRENGIKRNGLNPFHSLWGAYRHCLKANKKYRIMGITTRTKAKDNLLLHSIEDK